MDTQTHESMAAVRKWQRHYLLREYGKDGHVLQENLELSKHIDNVINALQRANG